MKLSLFEEKFEFFKKFQSLISRVLLFSMHRALSLQHAHYECEQSVCLFSTALSLSIPKPYLFISH